VLEHEFPKIRSGMGGTILTLALAGGGLLLASWVDAKVGESRRPESPIKLIGLCFVGVLLLQLSAGALYLVKSDPAIMAMVFGLFLPALVFAMLTGLWLLRLLAGIAGLARR
jgi:hypothetical protein